MSKKIQELLRYCEETFEKGNLESALRCAVAIALGNPNASAPYAHVTAYRILLTAANNRTVTGEPDWYAVMGIKRGLSSNSLTRSIKTRCLEMTEIFEGENGRFKAGSRVYDLFKQGTAVLLNEDRRRAYDQRSGFSLVN